MPGRILRILWHYIGFTGAWFFLITYLPFKWAISNSAIFAHRWANFEPLVLLLSIVISLALFVLNLYLSNYAPDARSGNRVPPFMLTTDFKNVGFFFGLKTIGFINKTTYFVSKPKDRDGNILIDGVVGMGKSAGIAKNVLMTWDTPIFTTDIKGELSVYYAKLKELGVVGRDYIIFDPNQEDGWGYDPYYLLRHGGEENLVQNANELAMSVIPLPPNTREPFWIEAAQNLLTAAILHFLDGDYGFIDTMTTILSTPIGELVEEIGDSDNENAKIFINMLTDLELKNIASIGTTISNRITVFATDPRLMSIFRNSQEKDSKYFSWLDLEDKHIFLCIDGDKITRWGSVVTLMTNQLIRSLERRPDKTTAEGKKILPILLLLDEIARFGKVSALLEGITTLRSKAVTFALIVQSLAQFDLHYGSNERKIIVGNCQYKALINVIDPDSQSYYSRIVGTSEVKKFSHSRNYDSWGLKETGRSKSWSFERESIVQPEDFGWLDEEIVLVTPKGYCRVDKLYAPREETLDEAIADPDLVDDLFYTPNPEPISWQIELFAIALKINKPLSISIPPLVVLFFTFFFLNYMGLRVNHFYESAFRVLNDYQYFTFSGAIVSFTLAMATIPLMVVNAASIIISLKKRPFARRLQKISIMATAIFAFGNLFSPFYMGGFWGYSSINERPLNTMLTLLLVLCLAALCAKRIIRGDGKPIMQTKTLATIAITTTIFYFSFFCFDLMRGQLGNFFNTAFVFFTMPGISFHGRVSAAMGFIIIPLLLVNIFSFFILLRKRTVNMKFVKATLIVTTVFTLVNFNAPFYRSFRVQQFFNELQFMQLVVLRNAVLVLCVAALVAFRRRPVESEPEIAAPVKKRPIRGKSAIIDYLAEKLSIDHNLLSQLSYKGVYDLNRYTKKYDVPAIECMNTTITCRNSSDIGIFAEIFAKFDGKQEIKLSKSIISKFNTWLRS